MIEMSVCEKDRADRLRSQTELTQPQADEQRLAEETGVDHHAVLAVGEQEAAAHDAADEMEVNSESVANETHQGGRRFSAGDCGTAAVSGKHDVRGPDSYGAFMSAMR